MPVLVPVSLWPVCLCGLYTGVPVLVPVPVPVPVPVLPVPVPVFALILMLGSPLRFLFLFICQQRELVGFATWGVFCSGGGSTASSALEPKAKKNNKG